MRADAGCELALLRADGGASRNGLLMQLLADALQVQLASEVHDAAVDGATLGQVGRTAGPAAGRCL